MGYRMDAFPDSKAYPDTGCNLYSRCLSCPLPRCQYDEDPFTQKLLANELKRQRVEEIRRQQASGVIAKEIASSLGLHRRSIYRILSDSS